MTLLGLRLRRRPSAEEATPEELRPPERVISSGPPLVLLAPTVAGVGCFQYFTFPDADTAAVFAEENFTDFQTSNIYAFWALQYKPLAGPDGHQEHRGEVLVLIREAEDSQVVYAVSFVDFDAADAFIRFEANRGLRLGLVSMYWALLITIEQAARGVQMTPHRPPRRRAHEQRQASHRAPARRADENARAAPPAPQPEAVSPPAEPEIAAPPTRLRSDVQAEVEAVLEAYRREEAGETGLVADDQTVAEEVAAPPEETIEPAGMAIAGDEELIEDSRMPEWPDGLSPIEERPMGVAEAELAAERPVVIEQVVADERPAGVDLRRMEAEEVYDEEIESEADGPDLFDVALEAAKTLRLRRWEKREEPFRGFNSPPGRF